ncbi:hypothetical protein Moror_4576 [Moniliophthora roreri MCA 2997]|uniref:Uncharacterized protein n=2 Tax=Moniliophthora roreri TaxID=221103 RepID=V2YL29_MONRO|nr:hypothetical protein Moror_4576 [Moniliophthora roreri MCA 2997]
MESQLEELQLITCSLLPGELFSFVEHCAAWQTLFELYLSSGLQSSSDTELPLCRFMVSLENYPRIHFEVEFPRSYPQKDKPNVLVKGEGVTRAEQEEWIKVVQERLDEILVGGMEYPVYQLLSTHLIPMLHEAAEAQAEAQETTVSIPNSSSDNLNQNQHHHALLTSHHLISPTKRRNLQLWSSQLSLCGFNKVGYPGVIYAEGTKENVEDFVGRIKGMNWLALRVRFIEALETEGVEEARRWKEFEKVGEVVEEMRRIGREKWIVEMGIGSSHSGKNE